MQVSFGEAGGENVLGRDQDPRRQDKGLHHDVVLVEADALTQETAVPGVYVAGDAASQVQSVVVAVGDAESEIRTTVSAPGGA